MNNDYVILINENGEPYIAHSLVGNIRSEWKSHKYVGKERLPNGKYRYFYSPEELKAFLQGVARRTKNDAKQSYDKAKNSARSAKDTIKKNANQTMENVRKAGKKTAKWVDDHDAGLTETLRYAKNRKTADQETKNKLHEEMTSTKIGRMASKVGSAPQSLQRAKAGLGKKAQDIKETAGNKAKDAAKWLDEHDAGLTETARYAKNRKTADQETKDRLHDEMTSTKIGKLASKIGSMPQKAEEVGNAAKNAATTAIIKGKNVRVYYPTAVSSMTVGELINAGNAAMGSAATQTLQAANATYTNLYNRWENASGSAKAALSNQLKTAETNLETARKEFVSDYNNFVDDHLKIKE